MNRAAREIALQALRNYLAGDLELTAPEIGEILQWRWRAPWRSP